MERTDDQVTAKVKLLQWLTIAWMTVELLVAVAEGLRSHSLALTAFGADSGIELLSASVVLLRFSVGSTTEKRAANLSSFLLYLLGVYIVGSVFYRLLHREGQSESSVLGIGLLVLAALVMPALGRAKRTLASATGSYSLRADAAQSSLCAYMSWIALAGLLLNTFFRLAWADAIAALVLLPIVLKEAGDARKGSVCECC